MRPLLAALLLALVLFAAACDTGSDPAPEDAAAEDAAAEDAAGEDAAGEPDAAETGPETGTLDDGVAATVNGAEISTEEVDSRLAAAVDDPQFAEALEGEEGELLAAQFRAQTLSVLVQTQIVLDSADRLDAHPTDEDIEQTRAEIQGQFGSEEDFEDALASSGMSREAFEEQLRSVAALDVVGRVLVERGDVPEESPEGVDPEEVALQQWLGEQFAQAEVVVDPAYGLWSPETGQVVPEQMAAPPAGP